MSRKESEISAAKRILHDAMEHFERAEESQQGQNQPKGTNEQRNSSQTDQESSRVGPNEFSSSQLRSMSVAAEQRRLFGHDKHRKTGKHRKFGAGRREEASTRKKASHQKSSTSNRQVWTFTLVCLADHQRNTPPSFEEKMKLSRAGLGEKRVSIGKTDDSLEVHNAVLDTYPALERTGYEMMRLNPRRRLELLQSHDLSAKSLKFMTYQAKFIYDVLPSPCLCVNYLK